MKALITGASGFIGSTLIKQLNDQGIEVFALMRKSSSTANLAGVSYQRIEGDLHDEEALKRAVRGMDYIFHLAGTTAAPSRDGFFLHNAQGTANLVRIAAEENSTLKRFIHVSSLAAAGPASTSEPQTESRTPAPVSFYGQSKLQGEVEALKYRDKLPLILIRPPMVYGPKDKGVFVIIQTVAKGLSPVLKASSDPKGLKYYSAVHSSDLCRGIILAAQLPAEKFQSGETFYLSGDEVLSYRDLLGGIAEVLGKKTLTFPLPPLVLKVAAALSTLAGYFTPKTFPLNWDKLNEILPDYWICSNEKAKTLLGFKPEFSFKDGMKDTIAWYRENKWL